MAQEKKVQRRKKAGRKKEYVSDFGKVFYKWGFPEYGTAWRDRKWYQWAVPLAIVLLLYSLFSGNYLFSVILVLLGVIYFFQSFDSPLTVQAQITEDGIIIGSKFYDYRDISQFWIIYEPPEVKNLYVEFANPLKPRLGIPLVNQNPLAVRETLAQYLEEDTSRENEPISDGLSRIFRLH